jgi:Protein of unknown function DUF72
MPSQRPLPGRRHGHSGKWDSRDITERFGYRYTDPEPTEWAPRMRALTEDTALTHVLVNTCGRDNAQANAHQRAPTPVLRRIGAPGVTEVSSSSAHIAMREANARSCPLGLAGDRRNGFPIFRIGKQIAD